MGVFKNKLISFIVKGGKRLLTLAKVGMYDVAEVDEVCAHGIDSVPLAGTIGVFGKTSVTTSRGVCYGYVNGNRSAGIAAGETRVYSLQPSGDLSFQMILKGDKTMYLGWNEDLGDYTDNMVGYNQLNSILTAYFTSLNTAIAAGVSSAGGSYAPPSAIDLSGAKKEMIHLM